MATPYFTGPVRPKLLASTVAALRAVASNLFLRGMAALIGSTAPYIWDETSMAADDGVNVIRPTDIGGGSPGRWLFDPSSGGGGEETVFATRALLRAAPVPPVDGSLAWVHIVGSGITIPFRYDATSVLADDGYTILQPTVGPGRWLLHDRILDIRVFDALPTVAAGGDPIQLAIDAFIDLQQPYDHVYLPTATWNISKPLFAGRSGTFVRLVMRGGDNIDADVSSVSLSGATIRLHTGTAASQQNFVFGIQGARACSFTGIIFQGENDAPAALLSSFECFYNTLYSAWVSAGLRTNGFSPHALFVVDPFSNGYPLGDIANGYPYFVAGGGAGQDHYGVGGGAFIPTTSSKILFQNCGGKAGVYGFVTSPGNTQNGAEIDINNPQFNACRCTYSFGNSQNRGITINQDKSAGAWFWIDNLTTGAHLVGGAAGGMPLVINGADNGQFKYMFNLDGLSQTVLVNGLYCEAVASLGRIGNGNNAGVCGAKFIGMNITTVDPQTVGTGFSPEIPFFFYNWGNCTFDHCFVNSNSVDGIVSICNNLGLIVMRECGFFPLPGGAGNTTIQAGFQFYETTQFINHQVRTGNNFVLQDRPENKRWHVDKVDGGATHAVNVGAHTNITAAISCADTSNLLVGDIIRIAQGSPTAWRPTMVPALPFDIYSPIGRIKSIIANTSFVIERVVDEFPFGSNFKLERFRWDGSATDDDIFTCDDTVTIGQAVYLSASNTVAQADASNLAKMPAIGIVVLLDKFSTNCRVVAFGEMANVLTGMTPGTRRWVSDVTPGALMAAAPTVGTGHAAQSMGYCKSATNFCARVVPDYRVV